MPNGPIIRNATSPQGWPPPNDRGHPLMVTEASSLAGGEVKWCSHIGRAWQLLKTSNINFIHSPETPFLGICKVNNNVLPQRGVQCTLQQYSWQPKPRDNPNVPNCWTHRENRVFSYNRALLSNKKK